MNESRAPPRRGHEASYVRSSTRVQSSERAEAITQNVLGSLTARGRCEASYCRVLIQRRGEADAIAKLHGARSWRSAARRLRRHPPPRCLRRAFVSRGTGSWLLRLRLRRRRRLLLRRQGRRRRRRCGVRSGSGCRRRRNRRRRRLLVVFLLLDRQDDLAPHRRRHHILHLAVVRAFVPSRDALELKLALRRPRDCETVALPLETQRPDERAAR